MGFWDAIVIMFIVGAVAFVRSAKYRAGAAQPRLNAPRESEFEQEVVELRKRIAVLERIATDERKSRDIAAEIESLRQ